MHLYPAMCNQDKDVVAKLGLPAICSYEVAWVDGSLNMYHVSRVLDHTAQCTDSGCIA